MNKLFTLTISSVFLVACGSGGGDSPQEEYKTITEPSLIDISGVWDDSETIDGELDVYYLVINEHGEFTSYDYDGDSFDKGNDCYYKYSNTITDLGNGSFEVVDDSNDNYTFNVSLSKDQLVVTGVTVNYTLPKSNIQESDFTPLCSELVMSTRYSIIFPMIKKSRIIRTSSFPK